MFSVVALAGLTVFAGVGTANADPGCIGRLASELAPQLGSDFGQLIRVEAQAGVLVEELHWLIEVAQCPL